MAIYFVTDYAYGYEDDIVHIYLYHYDVNGQLSQPVDLSSALHYTFPIVNNFKYQPESASIYTSQYAVIKTSPYAFDIAATVQLDGTLQLFQLPTSVGSDQSDVAGLQLVEPGCSGYGEVYAASGRYAISYNCNYNIYETFALSGSTETYIGRTDQFSTDPNYGAVPISVALDDNHKLVYILTRAYTYSFEPVYVLEWFAFDSETGVIGRHPIGQIQLSASSQLNQVFIPQYGSGLFLASNASGDNAALSYTLTAQGPANPIALQLSFNPDRIAGDTAHQ